MRWIDTRITEAIGNLSTGSRTLVLMTIVLMVDVAVGFVLFGQLGILLVGLLASIVVMGSGRIPVPMWMTMLGARPLRDEEAPGLRAVVELLAQRAGISVPALYVKSGLKCDAEVVGTMSDAGAIVFHQAALDRLIAEELGGIVAQKVAHLAHRDVVLIQLVNAMHRLMLTLGVSGLLGTCVALVLGAGSWGAPILVLILVMAGRIAFILMWNDMRESRAVAADTTGAMLLGTPRPLMRVLATSFRLSTQSRRKPAWMGFSPMRDLGEHVTEQRILSLARLDGKEMPWRPLFLGTGSGANSGDGSTPGVVIIRAPSVYVTLPPTGPVFRAFKAPPSKNA
ncbi:MAG: M48 family metalloprotease [Myxococcota bacterium]|nr:M48 family metalloprotease [Myxococcota bacterium]